MLSAEQIKQIVRAIHGRPELYGCRIVHLADGQWKVLHEGIIPANNYDRVVVIEEISAKNLSLSVALPPSTKRVVGPTPKGEQATSLNYAPNGSKLKSELVGAGIAGAMTLVSIVGVVGGVILEPVSGGLSTAVVVAGWTGVATSGAQFLNAVVRSYEAYANPDENTLQEWDDNQVYSKACLIVDGVGIVASLVQLPMAFKNLFSVLKMRGALVSADELGAMTKTQRIQAIKEAMKKATRTPEGKKAVEEALEQAGLGESQIASASKSVGTLRRAKVVRAAISQVALKSVRVDVASIVSVPVGVGASATPASMVGTASGSVRQLLICIHVIDPE